MSLAAGVSGSLLFVALAAGIGLAYLKRKGRV